MPRARRRAAVSCLRTRPASRSLTLGAHFSILWYPLDNWRAADGARRPPAAQVGGTGPAQRRCVDLRDDLRTYCLPSLISCLRAAETQPGVAAAAATAFGALGHSSPVEREAAREAGALPLLLAMVRGTSGDCVETGATALFELCAENEPNRTLLRDAGATATLMALLSTPPSDGAATAAAHLLGRLAEVGQAPPPSRPGSPGVSRPGSPGGGWRRCWQGKAWALLSAGAGACQAARRRSGRGRRAASREFISLVDCITHPSFVPSQARIGRSLSLAHPSCAAQNGAGRGPRLPAPDHR